MYKLLFSKEAQKDASKLESATLDAKCKKLLKIISENPFAPIPPFEKLVGDLRGLYSRRINIQHRLIYEVDVENRIVKVLRMWTHYE
jgi:Txe/YoeB family toxin of toxin-antitoxin system